MFRNPALQKLWYQIEAIALDLEQPEEIEDLTLPNVERLENRAGKSLKEFADKYNLSAETFKTKRKVNKNVRIIQNILFLMKRMRSIK